MNNINAVSLYLTYYLYTFLDWEAIVKLSDGFNGADLRNVCTEAGEFIIIILCVWFYCTYVVKGKNNHF